MHRETSQDFFPVQPLADPILSFLGDFRHRWTYVTLQGRNSKPLFTQHRCALVVVVLGLATRRLTAQGNPADPLETAAVFPLLL